MLQGQDRGRARQPRLGIVDIYDLDRQRQLILLRRDNVEHLLLIGGPNDVVIETNIVRVAGARLPTVTTEDRTEPTIERPVEAPPRPQVDVGARPSLEAQLAARLGTLVGKPGDGSDAAQELASVGTATATAPAHVEPMLKPDSVKVTSAPPVLRPARGEPNLRAPAPAVEPPTPRPAQSAAAARPAPPPLRQAAATPAAAPVPAPTPTPFPAAPITTPPGPSRQVPTPPAPKTEPAPAARAPEPRMPDEGILSNMARQLEEALKRPAAPAPQPPRPAPEPELAAAPLAPPPRPMPFPAVPRPVAEPPRPAAFSMPAPAPAPVVPASVEHAEAAAAPVPPPERPAPVAPSPAPAAPSQPKKIDDPFSVEEIEAEFARLLGRPLDKGDKS